VSNDLPRVAARVFDHPWSSSGSSKRHRTGFQRTLVRRVDVIDIEVLKCRHRIAGPNTAYHDEGVAKSDHGRDVYAEVSYRAERLLEELNLTLPRSCPLRATARKYEAFVVVVVYITILPRSVGKYNKRSAATIPLCRTNRRVSAISEWNESTLGCLVGSIFIKINPTLTAILLTQLAKKHHPSPIAAIRKPAVAGLMMRAVLIADEFRVTAIMSSSLATR
jgi:hypothetical protein